MMDILVTAIQSLCGAGLVLGIALSLYQAAAPRSETKGLDYATETGHRRRARNSR
jgi:hypothetical protein